MARPPETYIRCAVKDIWNEIHLNFACINNADRVGSEVPHISHTKSYFLQRGSTHGNESAVAAV